MKQDETLTAVRDSVRKLLLKEVAPRVATFEERGEFDREGLLSLGALGLAAPVFSEPYGMNNLMVQCIVAEEMGRVCSGFGLSALASVGLFGSNVDRQGTPEQKKKYLPEIATGKKIGCWALTEPGVGSDAMSIQTRCERKGDEYVLNGSKTFITNAPIADWFIVMTREYGADGKPVEGFQGGTAFILERGMPGLRTGQPFHKLGHKSSPTGEIFMENVRVPKTQVLGKPGAAFLGMKISLDFERAIFSGIGVGVMEFCLEQSVKYAMTRKQFGVPIAEHQLVQEKIAEMAAQLELTRTYQYKVIEMLMRGESCTKEAAILKCVGSRACFNAANEAVQVHGGYGYMQEYQVERCLRDAKLYEIGGGTTEIQKGIIAKMAIKEVLSNGR
jgi:alkylation response protein AidB-like acyl-CoA dehydrogenase